MAPDPLSFEPGEAFATHLDQQDSLGPWRSEFFLPMDGRGQPAVYFCSHSLGLQPRSVAPLLQEELASWAQRGVGGHFEGPAPWYTYQDHLRAPAARLLGARADEVIFMNGLTVNLHLLLATFYRPTAERFQILIEEPAFPSDRYAILSHLRHRGQDPAKVLVVVRPEAGEATLRQEAIAQTLERHGSRMALVFCNGVNFLTGQRIDMARLTSQAQAQGCIVGLDLAHAAGNVPLHLHDWNVDFAVFCTYKYLNSGPGAIGGCFVHERHGRNAELPRLAGWWGNDPATRFRMQLEPEFYPQPGAGGWQVSNPPILALAPIRASLNLFDQVGMPALGAKSIALAGYLDYWLDRLPVGRAERVTPRNEAERGAMLCLRVPDGANDLVKALQAEGIIVDFRQPDILRVAPVPFYNTFHEVWRFGQVLAKMLN